VDVFDAKDVDDDVDANRDLHKVHTMILTRHQWIRSRSIKFVEILLDGDMGTVHTTWRPADDSFDVALHQSLQISISVFLLVLRRMTPGEILSIESLRS
jgi:hypothetical protein